MGNAGWLSYCWYKSITNKSIKEICSMGMLINFQKIKVNITT